MCSFNVPAYSPGVWNRPLTTRDVPGKKRLFQLPNSTSSCAQIHFQGWGSRLFALFILCQGCQDVEQGCIYTRSSLLIRDWILVYSTGKRLLLQLQATIAEPGKATPHKRDNDGRKPALFSGLTLFEFESSDSAAMLGQRHKELKAVKYSFHITGHSVYGSE